MIKNSIKYKLIIWNIISLILLFALLLIIIQISVTSIFRYNIDKKLHKIASRELHMYNEMNGRRPPFKHRKKFHNHHKKFDKKFLIPPTVFNLDGSVSKFTDPEGHIKTLKPVFSFFRSIIH